MNTSITSSVVPEQKEQCVRVVADAARKGAGMAIDELAEVGIINTAKLQRVMAQGNKLASAVIGVVKQKIGELADIIGCLKQISSDREIIISATEGTETITSATDVFSVISPNFTGWGCDAKEGPTARTHVEVCKLIEDAAFQRIFSGFGQNLDRLCLTQAQVKQFAKDHKNWFCNDEHGTFFLLKVKAKKEEGQNEFFIAHVRLFSVGYFVADVHRFSSDTVRRAVAGYRVVVPKLV